MAYNRRQSSLYGRLTGTRPSLAAGLGTWVPVREHVRNCPRGMGYLDHEDLLIIRKGLPITTSQDILDAIPYKWVRAYTILNRGEQTVYMAFEEDLENSNKKQDDTKPVKKENEDTTCSSDTTKKNKKEFGKRNRPFKIHIVGRNGNTKFSFERTKKGAAGCMCMAGCLPRLTDEVTVVADDKPIAFVRQTCSVLQPKYQILEPGSCSTLRFQSINGKASCFSSCCTFQSSKNEFTFNNPGKGNKSKGRLLSAIDYEVNNFVLLEDKDIFCVEFPIDMEPWTKSAFLGAGFLFNVLYFSRLQTRKTKTSSKLIADFDQEILSVGWAAPISASDRERCSMIRRCSSTPISSPNRLSANSSRSRKSSVVDEAFLEKFHDFAHKSPHASPKAATRQASPTQFKLRKGGEMDSETSKDTSTTARTETKPSSIFDAFKGIGATFSRNKIQTDSEHSIKK